MGHPAEVTGKRPGTAITKYITNVRNLSCPFWRSTPKKPDQRYLLPFTSFAEPKPGAGREEVWFAVEDAPKPAFAGISRQNEAGNAFAFLTCEPNPLVAPIHPKAMPVILLPDDFDRWLAGDDAVALAVPFPSQLMAFVGSCLCHICNRPNLGARGQRSSQPNFWHLWEPLALSMR